MSSTLFDKRYLQNEFEKLDDALSENIDLYLIGGGSMSFQKYKAATKDIDVVVLSDEDLVLIEKALKSIGYTVPTITDSYKQMGARTILENSDQFRWDIFVNVICGGLQLSENMILRSRELFHLGNIDVYMISPEDIFVFKSITTRERDREDMYTLLSKGLNFDLIKNEIIWQNENKMTDFAWLAYFFTGLEEFFEKYNIYHPVYDELQDIAYNDMLVNMIRDKLRSEPHTLEDLNANIKIDCLGEMLESLVKKGQISKSKSGQYFLIK